MVKPRKITSKGQTEKQMSEEIKQAGEEGKGAAQGEQENVNIEVIQETPVVVDVVVAGEEKPVDSEVIPQKEPVIKSTPEPTPDPAPVVVEAVVKEPAKKAEVETKVKVKVPVSDDSEALDYLQSIAASGTAAQQRILKALESFIEALTPGRPASPSDVVKAQGLFLDHMLWVLDREDPNEFKQLWSVLLVGFKAHHGTGNSPSKGYTSLSEYRAGVYSNNWTDEDRLAAYLNLISVLRHTRNASTRVKDAKLINLDAISDVLVIDRRLENLKRFYNV